MLDVPTGAPLEDDVPPTVPPEVFASNGPVDELGTAAEEPSAEPEVASVAVTLGPHPASSSPIQIRRTTPS